MILSIEGSRNSGKTYLLDKFFAQNKDPRISRYKFDFAGWVDKLGLGKDDTKADLHYMCVGSLLTVMERHNDKDSLIVLDRGLFSCYVWSQLRKRISWNSAVTEIKAILQSPVYSNFHTVYVNQIRPEQVDQRSKDMWDNMHPRVEEDRMYKEFFAETIVEHHSFDKNCTVTEFNNHFENTSIDNFIKLIGDVAHNELVAN